MLKKLHRCTIAALLICVGVGLSGCAGVSFYSDPTLQNETGIPIYGSKPYLLVARTGAAEKPVEVSIVYLSDPQKIIYAKPRSGFGSANLKLSLANGQLTEFGQETDTKIPDLIDSLSGFITARAAARAGEAKSASVDGPAFELYEIIQGAGSPTLRRVNQ